MEERKARMSSARVIWGSMVVIFLFVGMAFSQDSDANATDPEKTLESSLAKVKEIESRLRSEIEEMGNTPDKQTQGQKKELQKQLESVISSRKSIQRSMDSFRTSKEHLRELEQKQSLTDLSSSTAGTSDIMKVMSLGNRIKQCMEASDYDGAILAGKQAIAIVPLMPMPYFKLAQAFGMKKEHQNALIWLRKTLMVTELSGMTLRENILEDSAFSSMREMPEFKALHLLTKSNIAVTLKELDRVPNPKELVYFPKTVDKSKACSMLVLLDGVGGNPRNILSLFTDFADQHGYVLLALCGSKKLGMNDKMAAYGYDFRSDPRAMVRTIRKTIKEEQLIVDEIYLLGFSQGGTVSMLMGLLHEQYFSGVMSISGIFPEPLIDRSTLQSSEKNIPFFLLNGVRDPERILLNDSEQTLISLGFRVKRLEFDGGHEIPPLKIFLVKALEWVDESNASMK